MYSVNRLHFPVRRLFRPFCVAIALLACATAHASPIYYQTEALGGSAWRYDYTVANDVLGATLDEFTIYFALDLYDNLRLPGAPLGWDPIAVPSDPLLPADGYFDALALAGGLAVDARLGGFSVVFDYLGTGTPGAQRFDIVDPLSFATLLSGETTLLVTPPTDPASVPEPSPLSLLIVGLLLLARRLRAAARGEPFAKRLAPSKSTAAAAALAAALALPIDAQTAGPTVGNYTLVSTARVGRTLMDFTYRAQLTNPLPNALTSPQATLRSSSPTTAVIDGSLAFPTTPFGSAASSTDTFTLRQDRTVPFDPAALHWSIGVSFAGTPTSLATASLISLPPVAVDSSQIVDGAFMTRLDLRIAATATVAQLNAMLAQVGGSIVAMTPRSRSMTMAIPAVSSFDALSSLAAAVSDLPGVLYAAPIVEPNETELPIDSSAPSFDRVVSHHHLAAGRFPAAWNARGRALDSCQKVPVVIIDFFGVVIPVNFQTETSPFFAAPPPDPSIIRNHGYDIVETAIAALGGDTLVSGANPFGDCLDAVGVQRGGLSDTDVAMLVANLPGQKTVLNFSFGYRTDCLADPTCPPLTQVRRSDLASALTRARDALIWKEITAPRWPDFLVTVSAGNAANLPSATAYPGIGKASFETIPAIAENPDTLFGFVADTALWDVQSQLFANAGFTSLAASAPQAARLAADVVLTQMSGVVADNVLTVGSTTPLPDPAFGEPTPSLLVESAFSSKDPDVKAVGEQILGGSGTSLAAPQVAGLASFLWLLSPTLRALPASATREVIVANAWPNIGSASGLIDAYATVLALDDSGLPSVASAPMRRAVLDLNNDTRFDEADVDAYMRQYFIVDSLGRITAVKNDPEEADHSRYDLNGDGFTGGSTTSRFDLDRVGSVKFGASIYSTVSETIEGQNVVFDEGAVSDLEILCYYAYSAVYVGSSAGRKDLLDGVCASGTVATAVTFMTSSPDTVIAQITFPNGIFTQFQGSMSEAASIAADLNAALATLSEVGFVEVRLFHPAPISVNLNMGGARADQVAVSSFNSQGGCGSTIGVAVGAVRGGQVVIRGMCRSNVTVTAASVEHGIDISGNIGSQITVLPGSASMAFLYIATNSGGVNVATGDLQNGLTICGNAGISLGSIQFGRVGFTPGASEFATIRIQKNFGFTDLAALDFATGHLIKGGQLVIGQNSAAPGAPVVCF